MTHNDIIPLLPVLATEGKNHEDLLKIISYQLLFTFFQLVVNGFSILENNRRRANPEKRKITPSENHVEN